MSSTQKQEVHTTTLDWDVNETSKLLGVEKRGMLQNENSLWRHQIDRHDILQGSQTDAQELCQCDSTSQVRNVQIICHNKDENDYDIPKGSHSKIRIGD